MKKKWMLFVATLFAGCALATALAKKSQRSRFAITDLKLDDFAGRWFGLVRMKDFKWEKGLVNTTATYSKRGDGTLGVRNEGYKHSKNGRHVQAKGFAKPNRGPQVGDFEVTFFWPFSPRWVPPFWPFRGEYVIAHVDPEYRHALIFGGPYFWVLGREPFIDDATLEPLLDMAKRAGYDLSRSARVTQDW